MSIEPPWLSDYRKSYEGAAWNKCVYSHKWCFFWCERHDGRQFVFSTSDFCTFCLLSLFSHSYLSDTVCFLNLCIYGWIKSLISHCSLFWIHYLTVLGLYRCRNERQVMESFQSWSLNKTDYNWETHPCKGHSLLFHCSLLMEHSINSCCLLNRTATFKYIVHNCFGYAKLFKFWTHFYFMLYCMFISFESFFEGQQ